MTDKEREAFEKWWYRMMDEIFDYGPHEERYTDEDKELAFMSWQARAAQSVRVPDGWKLVPCEPNDIMKFAGSEVRDIPQIGLKRVGRQYAAAIYRAMLSEAPNPPLVYKGKTIESSGMGVGAAPSPGEDHE